MKVLDFPLARIAIAFILGLLLAHYVRSIKGETLFFLLFITFVFFGIAHFLAQKQLQSSFYFGVSTYLLSFIIGVTTQIVHTDYLQKNNYTHCKSIFEKPHLATLTIREKLRDSNFNDRYIATVNTIDAKVYTGKIVLNIRKDSLNNELEIGTLIRINATLNKNRPPNNPDQFDYGKYLDNKQVYAQMYADPNEISIGTVPQKDLWYYASRLRTKIIRNLEKNNFHKDELNVALALIMGQQQDISSDIIRDYQYAGAVHILSVSGLHIGFILLFVTFILKPFPNTKRGSIIKLIVILASLSVFGIIAGLAPSVVRSVTMFSFVAIGNHLRRSVNIYHTLLVSILLILLFQPSFLFDVGFQLSYIALFFIIWFQPLLASAWIPKYKVTKYIWNLLTVSFAAQIGTLPLSLYYFHQFPGLFFVTNLLIIPFLGFIMLIGVLAMVLAAFNYTPLFLTKILELSIHYINKTINWIASFEQFIIQDISFNLYLLISVYLLILTSIIWLKKPNFNKLVVLLVTVIMIQLSLIKTKKAIQNQEEMIVFNSKKNTLITERNGKNVKLYGNDSLLKTYKKNNLVTTYLVANFSDLKSSKKLQNVIFYKGKKVLILDSSAVYPKKIDLDVLILTQSPKINLDRLFQTLRPKIVVADATNYKTLQKHWKASCFQQKIPFHSTSEKGFYKLE